MFSPRLPPGTRNLLIVLVATFILYVVLERGIGLPMTSWLAIQPDPSLGWSWQWATHWIVSDGGSGAFRKLIELLFVFLMGSYYERMTSSGRLYGLAVAGAIGSGLLAEASIWLTPVAPWGDAGTTSALICALAVRAKGQPMEVPLLGPTSAWAFVVVFGVVALVDSVYYQFVPIFASYLGASLAAYLYERWGERRTAPPSPPKRQRRAHGLRVIEGGGREDEPRYLNRGREAPSAG